MTGPVYLRCSNPACNKSNPIHGEVDSDNEYTCIFCGQFFKAPTDVEEPVVKKKSKGKKAPLTRQKAPINRNQNKPLL